MPAGRLSENAERYRKVKEELAFLEEEKRWLLELDEEGLQRHLYRLEEVLKREEEIVQAAEGKRKWRGRNRSSPVGRGLHGHVRPAGAGGCLPAGKAPL